MNPGEGRANWWSASSPFLYGRSGCVASPGYGRLDERNRAALGRMSNAMVHRGPDTSGTWVSPPDARLGALLAHRRLSILDLSPAGAEPMVDPVTGHVVVSTANLTLATCVAPGGRGRNQSTGDTAVMLRAIGLHGPDAVSWLRGVSPSPVGIRSNADCYWPGTPWASSPSTWHGGRIRKQGGQWRSPPASRPAGFRAARHASP